ncbi:MAG: hypothetical protein WCF82_23470 [Microcoleus sp.]
MLPIFTPSLGEYLGVSVSFCLALMRDRPDKARICSTYCITASVEGILNAVVQLTMAGVEYSTRSLVQDGTRPN